jgi:O-antigen/teichoic acid export membrane protein
MRIGQTSVLLSVSKFVGSIAGFLATLYFAQVLGAKVLGYYSLILVVTKWLTIVGDIGVASATNKRVSEADDQSAYFTAGVVAVIAFGVVVSAAAIVFGDLIDAYVGIETSWFVAALVPLVLLYSVIGSALKGERRVHLVALLTPVQTIGRSVVQISLVFVGFGLAGMIYGYVAGIVFATVLGVRFISLGVTRPKDEHFKEIYTFARYSWLGNLRSQSFNNVDTIVLGALVAPGLVGVYSVAWGLTNFVGIFGSSIRNTLFPEMSYTDANQTEQRLKTLITDSLRYNGLIAIPGFFGSLVVADRLLRIYGEEFTRGAVVLGLLILAMLVYDYQNQLLNALNAVDRPDISFRINAVFIVTNLCLNVALVLAIGWEGAAIATVAGATIGLLLAFRSLHRHIDFEVPVAEFGRQVAASLVMAAVVAVVRTVIEVTDVVNHNVIIVVSLVLLGAGTYFFCLFGISRQFRTTVMENAPVPIPSFP